jgi:hypothetical protein
MVTLALRLGTGVHVIACTVRSDAKITCVAKHCLLLLRKKMCKNFGVYSGRCMPYVICLLQFNLNKMESQVLFFANFTLTCDVKMKALTSVNCIRENIIKQLMI